MRRWRVVKKKTLILFVVIALALVAAGSALAYREVRNAKKKKESVVNENDTGKVSLSIPEGVSKIKVVDGTTGELIVLEEEETIRQFSEKLSAVTGSAKNVGAFEGYQYAVRCYRGEERCAGFYFMSETVVNEDQQSGGDYVVQIVTKESIPAYAYIEDLFSELRP